MAGLAVFFGYISRFELDLGFFYCEAVIVFIDEVCLGLEKVLWSINNPLGVAFNEIQ